MAIPKNYASPDIDKAVLGDVVDIFTNMDMSETKQSQDLLGRTYEYCLEKFAEREGKKGGGFYTPASLVKTLGEVMKPFSNCRIYEIPLTYWIQFNGVSNPRNAVLMRIFLNLGIVEHTGHGVPMIVQKYGKDAFSIQKTHIDVTIPFDPEVMASVPRLGTNNGTNDGTNSVADHTSELSENESSEMIKTNSKEHIKCRRLHSPPKGEGHLPLLPMSCLICYTS